MSRMRVVDVQIAMPSGGEQYARRFFGTYDPFGNRIEFIEAA